MAPPAVSLPGRTHRTTIVGKTGSGKTQFAAWLLSTQAIDRMPFIMIDYKYDRLLNSIKGLRELKTSDKLPKSPGLYVVHPRPDEDAAVERMMWDVWARGNIGLYFDEGTMVPGNVAGARAGAFASIQRQGRSKHIPCITVTQRPAGISRDCFSEADYFACLYLNTEQDLKRMHEILPKGVLNGIRQDYSCRWYDVKNDRMTVFSPVPNAATIRASIEAKIAPRRGFF